MSTLQFRAATLADTDRLGEALARALPSSAVIALMGTLGAGKTRLVQAIATACDWPADQVNSPTFVLCQHYHAKHTIHHFDAYRLRDDDEFLELGPEEYFDAPAWTFVEWGDRVIDCLPSDRIEITIAITDNDQREFKISTASDDALINRLRRLLGQAETS